MKRFFIIQTKGYVGVLKPGKCPAYSYTDTKNFKDFIKGIKDDYPDATFSLNRDPENVEMLNKKILYEKKQLEILKHTR